jgi:glycosyltransferase involved in cell wall biosynthesis
MGWVWLSIPNSRQSVVSVEQLRQAIAEQLGQESIRALIGQQLSNKKAQTSASEPISIIVCTRDRTAQLADCLQTLLALDYLTYEIIVVDNAPSNNDTARLAATLPVRYVREERPGLDWARNRGIAEARSDIVAFTDDDARVDRFWLQAIARAFAESEAMAVTGLVAPAELETTAQMLFEFDYGGMGHGFCRRIISRDRLPEGHLLWASGFGVGVNMAFRRELFNKIGTFDVALDVGTPSRGCGDVEMFHRVVAQGYTLIYEPAMLVWHTHRRNISALRRQLYDNGCSFGVYLMTCAKNRSVRLSSIVRFALYDWLCGWILRRLVCPDKKFPRYLVIPELLGMLQSPLAYRATQARAKQVAATYQNLETEKPLTQEAVS